MSDPVNKSHGSEQTSVRRMNSITLRVLEGADRGKVFEDASAPITIGREEGNSIQLNDERVSRFHLKIQLDHDDLVLTDLESTNGTKVNGEEIQLRILRYGDMITIGRSTMLFGSRDEINQRMERLNHGASESVNSASVDLAIQKKIQEDPNYQLTLLDLEPPRLPERLSPGQAAQMSEILEYLHMHMRRFIGEVEIGPRAESASLSRQNWQQIIDLQSRISEYLRKVGNPDET